MHRLERADQALCTIMQKEVVEVYAQRLVT